MSTFPAKTAVINVAAATTIEVVAAVTGTRIRVFSIHFRTTVAKTVTWRSATTAISGAERYNANSACELAVAPLDGSTFLLQTASGEALNLNLSSTATAFNGWIAYYEYKGT